MRHRIEVFLTLVIIGILFFVWGHLKPPTSQPPHLFGIAQEGITFNTTSLLEEEETVGLPLSFIEFFQMWPKNPLTPPPAEISESLKEIWSFGAVPVFTWEPMYPDGNGSKAIFYQKILMGNYDPYLLKTATLIKEFKHPILIRFAHEMNLSHYHWGTSKEAYGPLSPQIYIKMFQYVVDFFKNENVDNVLWVFCPNHESLPSPIEDPSASWNHATHYYPGDLYVDILGMDGYNWGTSASKEKDGWQSSWQSFEKTFSLIHNELRNISSTKPLMVFETASTDVGGDKAQWLKEALQQASKWNLEGLIWFQVDKEQPWSISKKETEPLDMNFPKRPSSQLWVEEVIQWKNKD